MISETTDAAIEALNRIADAVERMADAEVIYDEPQDAATAVASRDAYCACGHECWRKYGRSYDGCDCHPSECINPRWDSACGCIPRDDEQMDMVGHKWKWVR